MRGMASYRSRLQSAPASYDEVFQDRSVNITHLIVFFQEKGIQKFFLVWAVFMCVPLLNTRGHSHQSNSCSHQTKRCYKLDRQHLGPPWYRLEKAWLWRMFLTLAQVFFSVITVSCLRSLWFLLTNDFLSQWSSCVCFFLMTGHNLRVSTSLNSFSLSLVSI